MKQTNFPDLLKVTEVAEVFNCTPTTVRNMIRNESLSAIKLPGKGSRAQLRIPITELQKLLDVKVRKSKTKIGYSERPSEKKIKIQQILNEQVKEFEKYVVEVCNKLDCNVRYLLSKSRDKKIANLRHILALIGKVEFDLNDGEIGETLNRDRSSIIHARNRMSKINSLDIFQIKCIDACREAYKEMYDKDFTRLQLTE